MHVFVTGATGFVGRALVQSLLGAGHRVTAFVRSKARARNQLGPDVSLFATHEDDDSLARVMAQSDAVINLAGESVIGKRWSQARKQALWSSRVDLTERLVRAIASAATPPRTLLSASAVGYYGDRGDRPLDERSPCGSGELAALCEAWERAAFVARQYGCRVAVVRIGIVLGRDGGALSAMLPAFSAGLGGPLGSGQQYLPWIHLDDLVAIFTAALGDERMRGPINGTAPHPVTSTVFARALGRALRRPARLRVPSVLLRTLLGARAEVLTQSQRAKPRALQALKHPFAHPELNEALDQILNAARQVEICAVARRDDNSAPPRAQYRLVQRSELPVGLTEAFAFFCKAQNLGLITPSWTRFEILGEPPKEIQESSEIHYRIGLGPFPVRWKTTIRKWSPPHFFVDSQTIGPYRLWWHEHRLEAAGENRTIMIDRVYYALPLGWLGRLAHVVGVRAALRGIFGYRADAIRRLFAPHSTQPSLPQTGTEAPAMASVTSYGSNTLH